MNERWMKDMRDRFDDFEKPAPEGLLADVQREMQRRGLVPVEEPVKKGRLIPMWIRGAATAASVAVLLGVGALLLTNQGNDGLNGTEELNEIGKAAETIQTSNYIYEEKEVESEPIVPSEAIVAKDNLVAQSFVDRELAGDNRQTKRDEQIESVMTEGQVSSNDNTISADELAQAQSEVTTSTVQEPSATNRKTSGRDDGQKSLNPYSPNYRHRPKSRGSRWEVGANIAGMQSLSSPTYKFLAYANALTNADQAYFEDHVGVNNVDASDSQVEATPKQGISSKYNNLDIANTRSQNNSIVFVNKELHSMYVDAHHRQPVKVGLSVRYHLNDRWSIQTGIDYSYHSSDVIKQIENSQIQGEQKLHFVGVPVALSYSLWSPGKFNFYLTAGGEVEKLVKGTQTTKSQTSNLTDKVERVNVKEKPWQFSFVGSGGVQFNVNHLLSIYAEPGVGYYFDNKSSLPVIYQEKPVNFNLNMGIRFNINE
ncbi:MAG: PorT family protein [Bacteroidaceae bacterium]|nr:PorT family protein [Bacteroidaceae bacterium]